jgi:hypothetical protein
VLALPHGGSRPPRSIQTWPRGDPEGFRAQADGYKVGQLVFRQVTLTPTRFLLGPELVVWEGKDFSSLQVQLAGEERLLMIHGHLRLLAGHIYLRDWAYAFDSSALQALSCLAQHGVPPVRAPRRG